MLLTAGEFHSKYLPLEPKAFAHPTRAHYLRANRVDSADQRSILDTMESTALAKGAAPSSVWAGSAENSAWQTLWPWKLQNRTVRHADDAVLGFERQEDAVRVLAVLAKRFEKYALTLHPQKTRLITLHRHVADGRDDRGTRPPRSFDFLGFSFFWGRSRKGNWVVRRKTAKDRLNRALRAVGDSCGRYRHTPLRWQHEQPGSKLRGHYAFYGLTGNGRSLASFRHQVERLWRKWLRRRSNAKLPWTQFFALLRRYPMPPVRIVHSVYRLSAT